MTEKTKYIENLKARSRNFIEETQLPKTRFAANVGISVSTYNKWQGGTLHFKQDTIDRVENFLSKFGR